MAVGVWLWPASICIVLKVVLDYIKVRNYADIPLRSLVLKQVFFCWSIKAALEFSMFAHSSAMYAFACHSFAMIVWKQKGASKV